MSVHSYIEDLQKEKNISFRQIAKESGISYQTLLALKAGKGNDLSKRILTKLAEYENISMEELLFKIKLDPSITNICSENTLFYLCQKMTEDYKVMIDVVEQNPFSNEPSTYHYAGTYSKKTGNNLSYVEDWDSLKRDHWKELCKPQTFKTYDKYYLTYFKSKEAYFASVLSFGFLRVCNVAGKNIMNYDLIFSNEEEAAFAKKIVPAKSKIKTNAIYQPNTEFVSSGYVPEIFLNDIETACDHILEIESTLTIDQQNAVKKKLYKASKIIFQSHTFKNTFKNAEQLFNLQKTYNAFFQDKQSLLNFVDGKMHDLEINMIDSTTISQMIEAIHYSIFECCKTIKKGEYVNILILLNSI